MTRRRHPPPPSPKVWKKQIWTITGPFGEQLSEYVDYWTRCLVAYKGLATSEPDLTRRTRVLPEGKRGFRLNLLVREDGFRYLPAHKIDSDPIIRIRQSEAPETLLERSLGARQLCAVDIETDEGVFVYSDPHHPDFSAHVQLECTGLGPQFTVDTPEPEPYAQRMFDLRAGPRSKNVLLEQLNATLVAPKSERGRMLETLMGAILSSVKGFSIISTNVRTSTEEIDLLVRNNSDEWPWAYESPLLLVECKNWSRDKIGVADVKVFADKLNNRFGRTRFGLFVTAGAIPKTVRDEVLRRSTSMTLILLIDEPALRSLVTAPDKSVALSQIYLRAVTV